MAENTFQQKVEEELKCGICLDTYTNPKLLPCNHAFCEKCLSKLVRVIEGKLLLKCPSCRQDTTISDNGVASLQAAFRLNRLLEIVDEHRSKEIPQGERIAAIEHENGNPEKAVTSSAQVLGCCQEHVGQPLEYYCETCDKPVCLQCVLKSAEGKHSTDHQYVDLHKAYEKFKETIPTFAESLAKQLKKISGTLWKLNICSMEISKQHESLKSSIHKSVEELHGILEVRKEELITKLDKVMEEKKKCLSTQINAVEVVQAQTSSALSFVNEDFHSRTPAQVMMMKSGVVQQVNALTVPLSRELSEPASEADVEFNTIDMKHIRNLGQISLPDPSKSFITMNCDEFTKVGRVHTATLIVLSSHDQPWEKDITNSITCELVSEITGKKSLTGCFLENKGRGQYEIRYQPDIKGRHKLNVRIKRQHVSGSPYCVKAKAGNSIQILNSPVGSITNFRAPHGIMLNQKGELTLTQWEEHCVTTFALRDLNTFSSFGTSGSQTGQFSNPHSVAQDADGNIYVSDWNNHRVQKFTSNGVFIIKSVGTLCHPAGIGYNPVNNKVYVVEEHGQCVKILNTNLTLYSKFGEKGNRKGQFGRPWGIAFDSTGAVYITDRENRCVQVFTADGKQCLKLFHEDDHREDSIEPFGIAIDLNNYVYVVNQARLSTYISVFTSEGQLLKKFGRRDFPVRYFGIIVDDCGVVFACNASNGSTGAIDIF